MSDDFPQVSHEHLLKLGDIHGEGFICGEEKTDTHKKNITTKASIECNSNLSPFVKIRFSIRLSRVPIFTVTFGFGEFKGVPRSLGRVLDVI